MSDDTRFCYGANCTWCGPIDEVSNTNEHPAHQELKEHVIYVKDAHGNDRPIKHSDHALPCCPSCGGMLMQYDTPQEWWEQVDKYDADGHPGYGAMWRWQRQMNKRAPLCFRNVDELERTYKNRDRDNRFRSRHG